MNYLKYRLSEGIWGSTPVETINARVSGPRIAWASGFLDDDGYRIGFLSDDTVDLTGLEDWDVSEVSEAEALAFCANFYTDVGLNDDGTFTGKEQVWPFVGYLDGD